MKTMPLSEVKTKLSELVDAVERRDEVVSITRNGKPVAMIVSKEEYESWREWRDPSDMIFDIWENQQSARVGRCRCPGLICQGMVIMTAIIEA